MTNGKFLGILAAQANKQKLRRTGRVAHERAVERWAQC